MPQGVQAGYAIEVEWLGGMRYRGGREGGPTLTVDGDAGEAPSPVDTLLVAVASCSAIDIVEYLEKRRAPASALRVAVHFSRAATPPRRITDAELVFRVATAAEREHAERAAKLSFEKYCSVAATLAPDTRLSWRVELEPPSGS